MQWMSDQSLIYGADSEKARKPRRHDWRFIGARGGLFTRALSRSVSLHLTTVACGREFFVASVHLPV
jgi:hypothetical protein